MFNRRIFIKKSGLAGLSMTYAKWPAGSDKDYWAKVRSRFPIAENSLLNLNSGSAGSQSLQTQKAVIEFYRECNSYPFYEKVIEWDPKRKEIIKSLASIIGVSNEEITITRNTTEGLNTIINGYPFEKGDEMIMASSDYGSIKASIKNRGLRDGVIIKNIPLLPYSLTDNEIFGAYDSAITDRTKLVLLTHIEHNYGRILPVKKLISLIHSKGAEVVLDAAHSYGQLPHNVSALGADYYASSLHKWLNAPYGTGILYVKKDKIAKLRPLYPYLEPEGDDISKFNYLGTHASFLSMGIASALEEHHTIGEARKLERLQELTGCLEKQIKKIKGAVMLKNMKAEKSAISSFMIEGVNVKNLRDYLKNDHSIHTKTIGYGSIGGLRVSPNIYNNEEDIDKLIYGIKAFMK